MRQKRASKVWLTIVPPITPSKFPALRLYKKSSLTIVQITGDHLVSRQVRLKTGEVLNGTDIESKVAVYVKLNDAGLIDG